MAADDAVGSFFVHRRTGKVLRVLGAGRVGYQVVIEGLGRLVLPRRALHASYARAVIRLRAGARHFSDLTRREGPLRLTLRTIRQGHELLVDSGEPPRTERLRFAEAGQALFWFEKLKTLADVRALVSVARYLR